MAFFELVTHTEVDPTKKFVAIIDKDEDGEFSISNGAAKLIKERLERDYNVYTFWLAAKYKGNKPNQFIWKFKDDYDRKEDNPNYNKDNVEKFLKQFEFVSDLPKFEFVFIASNATLTLPLTNYCPAAYDSTLHANKSEYFDYIGSDEEILNKIHQVNDRVFGGELSSVIKRLSPYAISTKVFIHVFHFIKTLYDAQGIKFITLATDPNIARNFLQYHKIPFDFYYFVNDFRGTREYKEFPIGPMQMVFAKRFDDRNINFVFGEPSKTKNVVFAGTVFHEKGPRTAIWNEFLKDFVDPNSSYFIPIKKNGIVKEKENTNQISKVQEVFAGMYDEVVNHPSIMSFTTPDNLEYELCRFKFGLVFRCVSVYDSLNQKPYQYVSRGVLPLFDYKYDESYMSVPKDIKDALTIRNSDDIGRLVQMNESDRLSYLKRLREHFKLDEWERDPERLIEESYQSIISQV